MSGSRVVDNTAGEKLQKVLARAAIGSRREMERWIADGRVQVNDEVASLGCRVGARDQIKVDGKLLKPEDTESCRRVLLYNKPEGEVCTRSDPDGRRTVFDRLPKLKGERWICIGRLDLNTAGLLLFTTDGELANRLMHPSYSVEREYAVRVMGEVTPDMTKKLFDGVELDDGMARFTDIVSSGGEGINRWFHVVLMEGRNREVRRLWESQGVMVSRLKRVRYGNVFIPSQVKAGQWCELSQKEVDGLARQVELPSIKVKSITADVHQQQRSKRKNPRVHAGRGSNTGRRR